MTSVVVFAWCFFVLCFQNSGLQLFFSSNKMVSNIENTCIVIGKCVGYVGSRSDIYAHAITIARDKHYLVMSRNIIFKVTFQLSSNMGLPLLTEISVCESEPDRQFLFRLMAL